MTPEEYLEQLVGDVMLKRAPLVSGTSLASVVVSCGPDSRRESGQTPIPVLFWKSMKIVDGMCRTSMCVISLACARVLC